MDILDDLSKAPTSPNSYLTEDPYFPFYTRNHKRSRDENDRVKPWSPLGFLADNITRTLSFNQNPTSASISWFTSKIPNVNKSPLEFELIAIGFPPKRKKMQKKCKGKNVGFLSLYIE